jgi:hypothetical protein
MSSSSSFISFSTLSSKIHSVGIRLGRNKNEINVLANVLRNMKYGRFKVSPKLHNIVNNTKPDEEEAIATMNGQLLSSLVGVVSEVDLNKAMLDSTYEQQASGRKSKSSSNKKHKKRVRVSKSPIVSQ